MKNKDCFYIKHMLSLRISCVFFTMVILCGCSIHGKYYRTTGDGFDWQFGTLTSIELKKDSTAIYRYWTDIKMKKEGGWISNGDTIRALDMEFTHKGNKLIAENGTVWKKRIILIQKKYR